MEPDKIATIAALGVALVALLVASAQAIQQYFVSGQLIRICDSVVYNRMPGQGHRVWQFSQFRFRVVYSIPQVHLVPQVWFDTSVQAHSLSSDAAKLPSLSVQRSKSSLSAIAGEASWVSFVRAIQYSSGESLRYTMVNGDADRSPSDLPVVPMQLSMRDVVVVATMMGMECTDVSFQSQSLSMQGDAGTITSSRHPVLGALIHFAPKDAFGKFGIQAQGGTLSSAWVARMLDIITVAGQRYDLRDRRHFEEDEQSWIEASQRPSLLYGNDRVRSSGSSPSGQARRRIPTRRKDSSRGRDDKSPTQKREAPYSFPLKNMDTVITRRPQDGEWSFAPATVEATTTKVQRVTRSPTLSPLERPLKNISKYSRRILTKVSSRASGQVLPTAEPPSNSSRIDLEDQSVDNKSTYFADDPDAIQVHAEKSGDHSVPIYESCDVVSRSSNLDQIEHTSRIPVRNKPTDSEQARNGQTPLLLTDGRIAENQPDTVNDYTMIPAATEYDTARNDFMVDLWQEAFQQRRRERSEGRSRLIPERRLILRKRLMPGRGAGSSRRTDIDRSSGPERPRSRLKLAIEGQRPARRARNNIPFDPNDDTVLPKFQRPADPKSRASQERALMLYSDDSIDNVDSIEPSSLVPENAVNYRSRRSSHDAPGRFKDGADAEERISRKRSVPLQRGRRWNSSLASETAQSDNDTDDSSRDAISGRKAEALSRSPRKLSGEERGRKKVRVLMPAEKIQEKPLLESRAGPRIALKRAKPALREPSKYFPEDPDFVRPGVASSKDCRSDSGIPEKARFTKIMRRLVSPAALERGRERFEVGDGFVIVLRVLKRDEIEQYASVTQTIRELRQQGADLSSTLTGKGQSFDEFMEDSFQGDRQLSPPPPEYRRTKDYHTERRRFDETVEARKANLEERKHRNQTAQLHSSSEGSTGDEVDGNQLQSDIMDEGNHSEGQLLRSPAPAGNTDQTEYTMQSEQSSSSGEDSPVAQQLEEFPASTKAKPPSVRKITPEDPSVLTYAEEVLFLNSNSIVKKLESFTEQSKDIITTLQFVVSLQPDLEADVQDICKAVEDNNATLKTLLLILESNRTNKKIAEIVVADLDALKWCLQICLDRLQYDFDLFDITSMTSDERREIWRATLNGFEEAHGCQMIDCLCLTKKFGAEVASNLKIGTFKSPESALMKKHMVETSGFVKVPESPATVVRAGRSETSPRGRPDIRFLQQSPSRYMQSPSGVSEIGYSVRQDPRSYSSPRGVLNKRPQRKTQVSRRGLIYRGPSEEHESSETNSSSSTLTNQHPPPTGQVSWFWISQADALPGYFATPWKTHFSCTTCLGALTVLLNSIAKLTDGSTFCYVQSHPNCKQWLHAGKTTYPPYAHGANGGVVVTGTYHPAIFSAFESALPPLELLHSYDHQTSRTYIPSTQAVIDATAEIMALDSWLSLCGRLPSIVHGPGRLLHRMPTLVERTMQDFDLEFSSVDRTAAGGVQKKSRSKRIVETIEGSLEGYLEDGLGLEGVGEKLFFLVGMVRAVKMGLEVARGVETGRLREVLGWDVRIYMA
ncbi:MAG: hypothetical protein Q9219_007460 [cf. Caloplaca sp. 3 TL-2023]